MNGLFRNTYKGKKVLITGHTGFKGSWLCLWLSKMGAEIVGYSIDIPTKPSHFDLLNLKMTSVKGDILDSKKFYNTIKKHRPDIIFHLAAQALVRKSYSKPVETFETNIMGTVNLFESCRKIKNVKAIVVVTSDKCYQNKEQIWGYREDDAMGGDDPYSASKGCTEIVSNSYRKSFFNPLKYNTEHKTLVANVRAGNVIGGGDWADDRLIPDIMRATSKGKKVVIRRPNATRPWQHVLEPLSGYLAVGAKLLEGKVEFADNWNFGPSDTSNLSVHEVTEHTKKHWDMIKYDIQEDKGNVHEAHLLKLDSTKAHTKLKWRNIWDSHRTFEKTTTWYKNYYKNKKSLSEIDLEEYVDDARKSVVNWTQI